MSKKINIREVTLRDGLQKLAYISFDKKYEIFRNLKNIGFKNIEATSFSNPKRVPQFADAEGFIKSIGYDVSVFALVPNLSGMKRAINSKADDISVIISADEKFNINNLNLTIEQSLEQVKEILKKAKDNKINVRGYVAEAFDDRFFEEVKKITSLYLENEVSEVCFADSSSFARNDDVERLLIKIKGEVDLEKIIVHFHGDNEQTFSNFVKACDLGVQTFDSTMMGLGGCPFVKNSRGNLKTESLVEYCENENIDCGIDYYKFQDFREKFKGLVNL